MFAHANQGVVSGAVVLLLAACGGVSGMGQKSGSPPDTSNIEIHGDTSADVNKLAVEAIADLQDYWGKEFPHLYSKDYVPVKGGFFAVILSSGDLPPCASDASEISRNAFYRPDASTYHIRRATSVKGSRRCLFSRGEGDVERQGAGWARVKAFREGVIDGAQSCLDYKDS
jgi:hypothetical protein